METVAKIIAREIDRNEKHVENVIKLIDEGNTIPFIARYRKEAHGSMDDTTLRTLFERLTYLRNLQARREEVKKAIDSQGKLTDELSAAIDDASTLAEVEDLYRPYKQKRKTRATVARDKGLAPLAEIIFAQKKEVIEILSLAKEYINEEKQVFHEDDAIAGALDIIAEEISDNAEIRKKLRGLFVSEGYLSSRAAKEGEDSVYSLYYEFDRPISKVLGHQTLAVNRGEKEGFLKVSVLVERDKAIEIIEREVLSGECEATKYVKDAIFDSYERLIFPSMERETRNYLTDIADEGAIKTFALNLKPLLMQPPVKGNVTLGFDPAYRTGCKLAVVDGTGKVLDTSVVYPTPPHNKIDEAKATVKGLIEKYGITNIAIGNGTASRESENFISDLLKEIPQKVSYMVVSEAGASVYSASPLGAEEFPDFDVSLRSAVSIARRLQDPLAELVKIDPKAIGVGQYQHDMPQKRLGEALDAVVEDCVNSVGADLNTASPSLLTRVAGLNGAIAKNIVSYRNDNGAFASRKQLLKVSKLGPKAFEQCAGFLRVPESENVLDNTAVHPESYAAAEKLLKICGYTMDDVKNGAISELGKKVEKEGKTTVSELCQIGVPTLDDLIKELTKPGRDPREELPLPLMRTSAMEIEDLVPGTVVMGTVRNVVDFGVFVDIGVHQDGLVHISRICDKFIKHPSEVLSVGDVVRVVVLDVDVSKKRISLSIKDAPLEAK
ncbi:MAG: RNA-binding transcriptional accessory protein [Clostridiales bacterium]|nr:RNA-binding transcriptional accessory protein [Clostridiales bacterium]